MSYRCQVIGKAEANRAAALADIEAELTSMGWESWDTTNHVWASQGEAGTELKQYIELNTGTANVISCISWYYWNASTHAGVARATSTTVSITTSESGGYLWVLGNKNLVVLMYKVGSTYYRCGFGFPNKRQLTVNTTLTAGASSGSSVQITVASTTGFVAGHLYQIVGVAQEGRDTITVTSVDDSTHLTITTLPRNYGSGALIGQTPCGFGLAPLSSANFYSPFNGYASGTGTSTQYGFIQASSELMSGGSSQDWRAGYDLLEPVKIGDANTGNGRLTFAWYVDEYLLIGTRLAAVEDLMAVGKQYTATATAGGASTLTDSAATWTVDAYIGKCVLITAGTGLGQVRKITDNDATSITVDRAWDTQPVSGTTYMIANEGYIGVGVPGTSYFYARLGC